MDTSLTEKQKLILYKAVKDNGGVVQMSIAQAFYSSKNSARNALRRLSTLGFIKKKHNRVNQFDVVDIPREVGEELNHDDDADFEIEEK